MEAKKLKKILACILLITIIFGNAVSVSAQEIDVYSTNIGMLDASIAHGDGYLQGSAATSFTGDGCHAIYECTLQYLAPTGVWTTASDTHVVRVYEPGRIRLITDNFYGLSIGTEYRYHVYARVVNDNGMVVDSDVANSSSIIYRGYILSRVILGTTV